MNIRTVQSQRYERYFNARLLSETYKNILLHPKDIAGTMYPLNITQFNEIHVVENLKHVFLCSHQQILHRTFFDNTVTISFSEWALNFVS